MNVVIAIDSFKGSMTSLEAGESASAGYYDADKNWTFLSFQGKNSGIVAWADPGAGWFADKGDQLLAVLDTVEWEPAA